MSIKSVKSACQSRCCSRHRLLLGELIRVCRPIREVRDVFDENVEGSTIGVRRNLCREVLRNPSLLDGLRNRKWMTQIATFEEGSTRPCLRVLSISDERICIRFTDLLRSSAPEGTQSEQGTWGIESTITGLMLPTTLQLCDSIIGGGRLNKIS